VKWFLLNLSKVYPSNFFFFVQRYVIKNITILIFNIIALLNIIKINGKNFLKIRILIPKDKKNN
jgi:hypothetical protein